MQHITLSLENLHGTSVFVMPAVDPQQKKIYGATISKRRRVWYCPAFPPFHTKVLSDLETLFKGNYTISQEALRHIAQLADVEELVARQDLQGYEPLFANYAHQTEALSYAIHHPRCGLFLGRGLGKTKIAVDLLRHLRHQDPGFRCLILALRVNLHTWRTEMEKFTGGEFSAAPLVANGPKQRSKRLDALIEEGHLAIVCTYDTARVAHQELLSKFKYSMIVADESHKLRGHKSQQTKAVVSLAKRASRRLLLTGTPSLGNPMHLWGQLKVLAGFSVPGWWEYSNTYLVRSPYNQHIITGYKNQDRLNRLVSSLSIYKEAHECLDLPERTFQDLLVEPSSKQKTMYNSLAAKGVATVGGEAYHFQEPVVRLGKLAQVATGFLYVSNKDPEICTGCPKMQQCVKDSIQPYTSQCTVDPHDPGSTVHWIDKDGGPVIRAVKELCTEYLNEGVKVIVWAAHRAALNRLHTELSKISPEDGSPVRVLRFDSTADEPHLVENDFNESEDARVLVAQISMGIGVTFKAPVMLYAQMSPSLDHWLQSQDRNWGIRAKGHAKLTVQTISVRGSLQESMGALIKSKIDVSLAMTRKPTCVGCPQVLDCLDKGVEPFTSGCIFSKNSARTKLGLNLLK